ncbi:hypothetical protein PRUPE_5G035600 [Prunus persica]|uniref:Uncharacterized protein n=1 Tax=Prunus persica TaxID=3760 RepID=A0A251P4R5_PRUPE|nr:hypothetical protein PRUPE_5G035600 [Prunus persica]
MKTKFKLRNSFSLKPSRCLLLFHPSPLLSPPPFIATLVFSLSLSNTLFSPLFYCYFICSGKPKQMKHMWAEDTTLASRSTREGICFKFCYIYEDI